MQRMEQGARRFAPLRDVEDQPHGRATAKAPEGIQHQAGQERGHAHEGKVLGFEAEDFHGLV
jgi:hypothetical protein